MPQIEHGSRGPYLPGAVPAAAEMGAAAASPPVPGRPRRRYFAVLPARAVAELRTRVDDLTALVRQLAGRPAPGTGGERAIWWPDLPAGQERTAACTCSEPGLMKCSVVITPNLSRTVSRRAGCWHGQTRQNHRVRMLARLGWRWYSAGERELLAGYLLARAGARPAGRVAAVGVRLVTGGADRRRTRGRARSSRRHGARCARAETYHRMDPLLQPPGPMQLDGLSDAGPDLGITRLAGLRRGATALPGGARGGAGRTVSM
jgi:hypothetical protein